MASESGRKWEFKDCAHFWSEPEDEPPLWQPGHSKNDRIIGSTDNELYPLYINLNGKQYKIPVTVPLSELGG